MTVAQSNILENVQYMNIEIVAIGDELLLGFITNTNAAYLARELAPLGVRIMRSTTCADDAVSCPGLRGHLLKVFTLVSEVFDETDTAAVQRGVQA